MSIHVTLLDNVFISQGVIKYYNICGTTLIRLKKRNMYTILYIGPEAI